jgi:antitoxin PrlF
MSTVTSRGRVTLPKHVRDALGIEPGTEVEFELEEGRAVMRKRVPTQAPAEWEGKLRGRLAGNSVDETMEMLRGGRLSDEKGLCR